MTMKRGAEDISAGTGVPLRGGDSPAAAMGAADSSFRGQGGSHRDGGGSYRYRSRKWWEEPKRLVDHLTGPK